VFLEDSLCRIHPVKPSICRAWPFLEGIVSAESIFQEARLACPGLKNMSYHDLLSEYEERQNLKQKA
jgi:Fe-S-cluster containining protein